MINNKTYQNVIDVIAELGDKHQQIATVTTGDIYDIDLEKGTKYPLMHINVTSVQANESSLKRINDVIIQNILATSSANNTAATNAANVQSAAVAAEGSKWGQIGAAVLGMNW